MAQEESKQQDYRLKQFTLIITFNRNGQIKGELCQIVYKTKTNYLLLTKAYKDTLNTKHKRMKNNISCKY